MIGGWLRQTVTISFAGVLFCQAHAGEEIALPTKITLTAEESKEINSKKTLRGRPVTGKVYPEQGVTWDGIQAFTGRKPDVIDWLITEGRSLDQSEGPYYVSGLGYCFAILCSDLLKTGDQDIMRAVLWNTRDETRYSEQDRRALIRDKRLSTPERIVACNQSIRLARAGNYREEFWRLFGEELTCDHLLEILARGQDLDWGVLSADAREVPVEKAKAVLLPCLRREYLSINEGRFVKAVAETLVELNGKPRTPFVHLLLDEMREWDSFDDVRSAVLWEVITFYSNRDDDATSQRIWRFVAEAKAPPNAGEAFWTYAITAAGRKAIGTDGKGWAALFSQYVEAAERQKERRLQLQRLMAFVGWYQPPDAFQSEKFVTSVHFRNLMTFVRDGKVELSVTPHQYELLTEAWRNIARHGLKLLKARPPTAPPAAK